MPNLGDYLNWREDGTFEEWYRSFDRADNVAFMIGHRGVSVTVRHENDTTETLTALLVPPGRTSEATMYNRESGKGAHEQLLLITQPDENVTRGDRFMYPATAGRLNYHVVRVEKTLYGFLTAYCEEVQ